MTPSHSIILDGTVPTGPFAAGLSGALGGFAASFLAQGLVTLLARLGLGWNTLQGPAGPPFFPTAIFLGVFYGVIGAALSRRAGPSLIGLLGPVLGMIIPFAILERLVAWNWGADVADRRWLYATMTIYGLATWSTIAALGWNLGSRWLGAGAAVAGSFAAYLIQRILQSFSPALAQGVWSPGGLLPQATVLLDGLMTGAFLGVSTALARGYHEKARRY